MSACALAVSPTCPNVNNKRALEVNNENNQNQHQQQQGGGAGAPSAADAAAAVVVSKRRRGGAGGASRCFVQDAAVAAVSTPSYAAGPTTLLALRALFPEMAEQDVADVLYSCGDDIDAAVRRLSELRLRPDGTAVLLGSSGGGKDEGASAAAAATAAAAAASGRATPELVAPSGPGSDAATGGARSGASSPGPAAEGDAAAAARKSVEASDGARQNNNSDASASASAPPAEVDAWAEGLVGEMAAASDVGDARSRAATVLRGFEAALLLRVSAVAAANSSPAQSSAAATAARSAALERDCSLLKRAVALQASRLQLSAQQRQQESLNLTRALQEARARVQQLEMSNFALAAHLRAATEGGGGVAGSIHGNGNGGGAGGGGGGGGHFGGGGPGGGFASPSRDVY